MSAIRALCLSVLLACLTAPLHAVDPDGDSENIRHARQWVEGLAKPGAPGCALGVSKNGDWIFREAYGYADIDGKVKNTPRMVFGVASVSKQFTAAATAIAAHHGHFSLDDDIRLYVPEMPDYGAPITIRHLVHHTNGLRDINRLTGLTGKERAYDSRASRIELLARQRAVNFPPGAQYLYGNSGYLLLTEIIERTTGQPFAEYVRQHIFRPLGMQHSYFGVKTRGRKGRALPYTRTGTTVRTGTWRNDDDRLDVPATIGHGGLMTTLDDYRKWADNLTAQRSKLAGGAALTRMLRTPGKLKDGSATAYGFGLRRAPYRGLVTIHHSGSGYGYKAQTMIFPDRGLGVFGFCNDGDYAQSKVMKLADIFLDLADDDAVAQQAPAIELPVAQLEQFAGVYREPSLRLPLIVQTTENGLRVIGDARPYVFQPVSPTRFRNDEKIVIEFTGCGEGEPCVLEQREGRHYGIGKFQRIEPRTYTGQQLGEFTGDYYSAELDASYRFVLKAGKLTADILDKAPDAMGPFSFRPMIDDEFVSIADRMAIRFQRDEGGVVTGFLLTHQFGWITDIVFERVAP